MTAKNFASTAMQAMRTGLVSAAIFQLAIGNAFAADQPKALPSRDNDTATPIKHVIVIIGENRTFDHVFATYVPPKSGETVNNLLSEGIVKADGTPGPNFAKAHQVAATDTRADGYLLDPTLTHFPGYVLPAPLVGGPKSSYVAGNSLSLAQASENGLPAEYYQALVSGGAGQTSYTPDTRITNVNALDAGPFQLTNGSTFTYNSYAASPVHRFYQMWQQLDCAVSHITPDNPSGCSGRLFPWVETTVGAGTNGKGQPGNFNIDYTPTSYTTGEGSTSMGFYNMQNGDAPYFKYLADNYAMSDNFHQSVNGGTGANHIMFGHADAIWFSNGAGTAAMPPHDAEVWPNTPNSGVVNEVEDPTPQANTNNWYSEDGYGDGGYGAHASGGGSYSDCSDTTQPGVAPIVNYLKSLTPAINPRCEAGHYYLLNNYNPGYFGNGHNAYTDQNPNNTPFTIPPSSTPSIGDDMIANNVSWKYYGDQWNNYVPDPYQLNYYAAGAVTDEYCNICNPFQYDTSIMANATVRTAHIQDTANLYSDITNGTLPAVSIVKPSGLVDGHPSSSKLNLFEGFTKKIVDMVHANPSLWADTAIFITEDEGGGYYDSGYVQPVDFFGDGTRIPLILVSPYAKSGHVSHDYADHVSIDKFIEANWGLPAITNRSRDNFPNPVTAANPYIPVNSPAITDLFDLFDFTVSN
jgi:phospholipase C